MYSDTFMLYIMYISKWNIFFLIYDNNNDMSTIGKIVCKGRLFFMASFLFIEYLTIYNH